MIAQKIREIVFAYGKIPTPSGQVADGDDLFKAGLQSFNAVQVMMAIEERFDIEFSDDFLKRETFSSLSRLQDAVTAIMQQQN